MFVPPDTIDSMDLLRAKALAWSARSSQPGQIVRELVEEAPQIIAQRLAGLVATGEDRG